MASKPTLLEQARKIKDTKYKKLILTEEDIDLAIAWAEGDVSLKQVMEVKSFTQKQSSKAYQYLVFSLREYIRQNPPTPKKK